MPQNLTFTTHISGHTSEGLELRGEPLNKLIEGANFVSTFFLSLTGRKPKRGEEVLLNAVMVSCIDHGIEPASGFVPRVSAASGNTVIPAMAAGLLALGPYHGGAISQAMTLFAELEMAGNVETAATQKVKEYREQKKRLPGFGHPVYKHNDPRVTKLFGLARTHRLPMTFMDVALTVETVLETELGKKLVLNIDGGIAALLLTLGIEPEAGDAVFAVARMAGSIAHIVEERTSGQWVRRLESGAVTYEKK